MRLTTNFWGSGALRFSTNLTGANSVDEYFVQRGGSAATKDFLINHVPTAGKFAVMTSNENARLIVDGTSGNVGIGTTAPTAKLEVNGSVKIGSAGSVLGAIQVGTIGTCASDGSAGYEGSVTFPTAFSSAPRIFLTVDESFNNAGCTSARVYAKSNTGFSWNSYLGGNYYACDCIHWMAIGP